MIGISINALELYFQSVSQNTAKESELTKGKLGSPPSPSDSNIPPQTRGEIIFC